MAEGSPGEKKSDETWKERALKEKERLAREPEGPEVARPTPTFLGLVEELYLHTLLALGQLPNPATGEVSFDPEAARYTIDLLGVLEEKTKGNLQPTETAALDEVLHKLRMIFVQVCRNPPQAAGAAGGPVSPDEEPDEPERPGPRIIL